MGMSLTPVPFWVPEFEVSEVISATHAEWFDLEDLTAFDSVPCSLYQIDGSDRYMLRTVNGQFVEFVH